MFASDFDCWQLQWCRSRQPKQRRDPSLSEVWLHVHDTNPLAGRLNELILRRANFGAFHSGVEVLGVEWSFQGFHGAWDDPTISGVVWNEPRLHPSFPYRESVAMGQTPLSREAISKMLDRLRREWSASSYHLVPKGISQRRLPMTWRCRLPCVGALASCGWDFSQWWSRRHTRHDDVVHAKVVAAAFAVRKV